MASGGVRDFIKSNVKSAGVLTAVFSAGDLKNLATGNDMLKSTWNIFKNIVLMKPLFSSFIAGAFGGMGKAIRSIVKDTGSLEAALNKLARMQSLAKVFQPLVGGADAAKRKVAELANFAASRNLELGGVAEASRKLMVMSRGALGAVKDLDALADAADFTGNSIENLADATGRMHAMLREGGDISSSAEELRQMGAISQQAADSLADLQKAGATNGAIFAALQESMADFRGGLTGTADEIAKVNSAYEAAKKSMATKFGSPWVASEIENTKNYTAAMQAMAPTLGSLSQGFSALFNGFSTTWSWIVKVTTQSAVFQIAVKTLALALGALSVILTAFGINSLVLWLVSAKQAFNNVALSASNCGLAMFKLTGSLTAASAASRVATVALTALNWVVKAIMAVTLVTAIISIIGALKGMWDSSKSASDALQKEGEEHKKATQAILEQVAAIDTLMQKHEALVKAIAGVEAAQAGLEEAQAAQSFWSMGDSDEVAMAKWKLQLAKTVLAKVKAKGGGDIKASDDEVGFEVGAEQRRRELAEQAYQESYQSASPEEKQRMAAGRIEDLASRKAKAELGLSTAASYSQRQTEADIGVTEATAERDRASKVASAWGKYITDNGKNLKPGDMTNHYDAKKALEEREAGLVGAKKRQAEVGLDAAPGTSTYENAMWRTTKQDKYRVSAALAKADEGNAGGIGQSLQAAKDQQAQLKLQNKAAKDSAANQAEIASLTSTGVNREIEIRAIQLKDLLQQRQNAAARNAGEVELSGIDASIADKKREIEDFKRDESVAARGIAADSQAANSQAEGLARERGERAIRIKELMAQQADARKGGDTNKANEIGNQIAGLKRQDVESLRGYAAASNGAQLDSAIDRARLAGDTRGMTRISNLKQSMELMQARVARGENPEEAKAGALADMKTKIALQGKENYISALGVTVASSLAKVGGGGNVATSYARMEDLAAQNIAVANDTNKNIKDIAIWVAKAQLRMQ